jgi:hypothetical protein
MGFRGQLALQKLEIADVSYGSLADPLHFRMSALPPKADIGE